MDPTPIPMAEPRVKRATSRQRSQRLAVVVACVALGLAWLAIRYVGGTAERRAIEELPEQERRALYERTLKTLTSSCEPETRPRGLDGYCNDQATFIVSFPECDASCQALASRLRRGPTR